MYETIVIYDKIIKKGNDMIDREKEVIKVSIISILSNIVLVFFKMIVGLISNSIAIISDAINNLTDALSSIITIVGTKLAGKKPDKKHPYGYGRIEYITAFIVSAIVLYAGIAAFVESFKTILNPSDVDYSMVTLIILIFAIIVKISLGIFVKNKGKQIKSSSLVASGSDSFNDALLSISVLLSIIIYLIFKINIESYVSTFLSLFIIKSGLELIKESVDNMIGTRVDSSLTLMIKKEIKKESEVKGVFDLILNNYGPDMYLGSVHIEIDDSLTVTDVDKISRRISKRIYNKFGVVLHTIGIYSINTKDNRVISIQKDINKIIFSHKEIIQMHGFYIDEEEKTISLDIIIDFNCKNKEGLYGIIYDEIKNKYSEYNINITLDIDISD